MTMCSRAQTLPPHVIENVAEYLIPISVECAEFYEEPPRPAKWKELLPLVQTCTEWRGIVGPIFYRAAELHGKGKPKGAFGRDGISTADIVKVGAQPFVKELYITVSLAEFDRCWDGVDNPGTAVSDYGDWPWVHSIVFILNCGFGHAENESPNPEVALVNIQSFADKIKQHIPNVWKVKIFKDNTFESRFAETGSKDIALENIGKVIGANTGHLSLAGYDISNHIVSDLMPNTLRSLSISRHKGTQKHIELVRHNADTLESLCVDHITTHSMLKMTWGKNGSYHTQVYPRLKMLHIRMCVGQRNKAHRQPLADPFPRLQTLICRGHFPFSTPIVLIEGRSHIRHLDIDLDTDLLQAYADHRVFAKGSFLNLDYVSLGWSERTIASRDNISMELYSMTVELCAGAQIMRIRSSSQRLPENMALKLYSATHLRSLDMPHHIVRFTTMVLLLGGLRALQKANVAIGDGPVIGTGFMPSLDELRKYQKQFTPFSTNAWALGIRDLDFHSSRRAGEFLVLLVDILGSIKRISIHRKCSRPPNKIINATCYARKRPVYKDSSAIHSLEFVDSDFW